MERDQLIFENQFQREISNWNVRNDLKGLTVPELIEHQPKLGFTVAAVNVEKGLNVGSMIRTSVCFGANEFILVGNKRYDKRSTVGAQNYINITKKSFEDFLYYCNQMSYLPIAIETNGKNWANHVHDDLNAFLKTHKYLKPCFIFGGEAEGIPDTILNQCKFSYKIHQPGILRSLNVSVVAGIVLNNWLNGA